MLGIVATVSLLNFIPHNYSNEVAVLGFLSYLFSSLLIFTLPQFVHNSLEEKKKRILNRAFMILSGFSMVFIALTFITQNVFYGNIILITMGLTIGYSMILLIVLSVKNKKNKMDLSTLISGIVTIILMPLVLLIDFDVFIGEEFSDYIGTIIFFPGLYLILNLIFIVSSRKHFIVKKIEIENFTQTYGISKREVDVLMLLTQGKSYQEIADLLNISLSTVKTHISRLYQKTNTKNKVELSSLIYKSTESTT